jgi:hypothetical protein
MRNRFSLLAALLVSIAPAMAAIINVTADSQVTLGTNDSLIFTLSTDYANCSRGYQYPSEIEMLLGSLPLGGPVAPIPGTSSVYMPGILFTGAIESENGGISIPLTDPDAARVGLPTGDILLTPGSRSGGSYSGAIDLLSADAALSSAESAALFASGDFTIDLHNIGAPIAFGFPGTLIGADFTASLIGANGSQSVGADVIQVECVHTNAPEPGTIGLLIIGISIVVTRVSGPAIRKRAQT